MFTKSIRWRFQSWLAFLLVCILSGFGGTAYQLHRKNQFDRIDQELQRRVASINTDMRWPLPFGEHSERGMGPLGDRGPMPFGGKGGRMGRSPPDEESQRPPMRRSWPESQPPPGGPEAWLGLREVWLSPQTLSLFNEAEPGGFYYKIWSRSGRVLKGSTNTPPELVKPATPGTESLRHVRMRGRFREAYYFTGMGDCIFVGRSLAADLAGFRRYAWWLAAGGAAILALGLGGGWWLVGQTLRPVAEISATARRISAGNLSERINVAEMDNELGQLAGVLNSTFARLEDAFDQQKQFIADAAHELRTPIAVILSEAQTTLARERGAHEYRETVEACLDTAQQMRRLTEVLLALARFDAGEEPLERRRFDLAETARACVDLIRPLATQRGIQIQCDLAPTEAQGDPERLAQVITNLLSNALYFNRPEGAIRIRTQTADHTTIVSVADTGIGVAPEHLPHLFTRFFRVDQARVSGTGRTGLGLSICKAIVDAHRGRITVASQPGEGTTFTVQLPA